MCLSAESSRLIEAFYKPAFCRHRTYWSTWISLNACGGTELKRRLNRSRNDFLHDAALLWVITQVS